VFNRVDLKNSVFYDITTFNPAEIQLCFEGIYKILLRGRKTSLARNQQETGAERPGTHSGSCSIYSVALMMEAIFTSESLVNLYI
jgi:hypothetical protein